MKRSLLIISSLLLWLFVPVDTVRADEELTLDTVIEAWVDALGGREKLESIDAMYTRYDVTIMGLNGSIDDWVDMGMGGRHHLDLNLADMFKIVIVSDNGAGWTRDQNGKISRLAGADLEEEVTRTYLATMSHLLPGRMSGTVTYDGPEDVTGYHIVRAKPDGGVEVTYYLDPETFLPVRMEQPQHDRTVTATFSEWKSFEGILFATRTNNTMGDPQHDQLFVLAEVEMNPTIAGGIFQKPEDKAQDYTFTHGNAAHDIPIELNFVHIFVQAQVNGSEPLWFIFDTGASVSVLNTSAAKALGMDLQGKIEGRGAGEGSVEANLVKDVTFELPGVKLEGQTSVTVPLDQLEPIMGRRLDGILGYDLISRFVVEIDYANQRLHLYDRAGYAYQGSGVRVPLHIDAGTPHIEASVTMPDGRTVKGNFLIDTGANMTLGFTRPFADEHDLLESLPDKYYFEGGAGVGGEMKSYIGRVQVLDIGGLKFINPVAGFSRDQGGAGADPTMAGIIGGEILSRCTVVFDYDAGEMILEPNANFEDPYDFNTSGLTVQSGGREDWHTLSVRKVMPDTPAADAGLKVGDVIQEIDGRPAREYTIHTLGDYLKRYGHTIKLTIRRDGKTMEKDLRLKKMI